MHNFDQHQQRAFRQSLKLVMMLAAAIVGTVVVSALAMCYAIIVVLALLEQRIAEHTTLLLWTAGITAAATTIIVTIVGMLKTHELKHGGHIIAVDLGGRLLDRTNKDPYRQKVLNIVDEMAISAGIPAPPVYLLEGDSGINAFAAGYLPDDAIIGVTEGAIRWLKHDHLQGVIAHEFSHILNGDMRLNVRMLGASHGLVGITIVAESLIKGSLEPAEPGPWMDGAAFAALMVIVGVILWPVGLIGATFSMIVKSALNREREYLADAFAVQFTRNPQGLAGALKYIVGSRYGTRLNSGRALEVSHMLFANGFGRWEKMFASHPPIQARILRLDPAWDGVPLFDELDEEFHGAFESSLNLVASGCSSSSNTADSQPELPGRSLNWGGCHFEDIASTVATPLLELAQAADAVTITLAAVWIRHATNQENALALLDESLRESVATVCEVLGDLNDAQQLVLFDLSLQSVVKMSADQRNTLAKLHQALANCREDVNLFHWMWSCVLSRKLSTDKNAPQALYGALADVQPACEVLLSALAHVGSAELPVATFAFQRAVASFGLEEPQFLSREACGMNQLSTALDTLAHVAPRPLETLLVAAAACVTADRTITPSECALIRVICCQLGSAMPDLLPGPPVQRLTSETRAD